MVYICHFEISGMVMKKAENLQNAETGKHKSDNLKL